MRRVVLKMSVSVDGYAGLPGDASSWVLPSMSVDATEWVLGILRRAGTHVLGRVAYEEMEAYWPTSTDVFAAPMNETPKVVLSASLTDPAWANTTVARGDLATEIDRLRREPGGDIVVHGGAGLARSLTTAGLVDEYRLLVHPVALGAGLRLFASRTDLRPIEVRPFIGGAVGHTYHRA